MVVLSIPFQAELHFRCGPLQDNIYRNGNVSNYHVKVARPVCVTDRTFFLAQLVIDEPSLRILVFTYS